MMVLNIPLTHTVCMASNGFGTTGEPMRVALYVRVSTEDQVKEGFSLESQRVRGEAYCTMRGWRLVKVYVEEGRSARGKARRPEYEHMMRERAEWDVLLVAKLDRVWRNAARFLEMIETLRKEEKEFASVADNLDTTTPMGRFVQTILAAIAELESAQIQERVLHGMSQKFAQAEDAWQTRPPLGFAVVDGHLITKPEEASIVREMFHMAATGKTADEIVTALNAGGFRGKAGGAFVPTSVLHILRNPAYAGYVYWDGMLRRNGHDALVSDDTFNAAQVAIFARTRSVGRNKWPLIVGAKGMTVQRVKAKSATARSAYYYVTDTRPAALDGLIAAYLRARPPKARKSQAS